MSKTKKAFFARRVPFSTVLLREVLVEIFAGAGAINKNDAFSALNNFTEGKGWTLKKSLKLLAYLLDRGFCREKGRNLIIVKTRFKSLDSNVRRSVEKNHKTGPPSENQKTIRQNNKLAKAIAAKVAPDKMKEMMLNTIFTGKTETEFPICKMQRLMYEFMCTEWHTVKGCKNKGADKPTANGAAMLFKEMVRKGIFEQTNNKLFVRLTHKGAVYCRLVKEYSNVNRLSKRQKFSKQFGGSRAPKDVKGLRSAKKTCKSFIQEECAA